MTATTSRLTLEQFLERPETEPASEYWGCGDVHQKDMPDYPHATLQFYLAVVLTQYLRSQKLRGKAVVEWCCVFGPSGAERAWVPDVVVVLGERAPQGDARNTRVLRVAPDIAIEVLSPKQSARLLSRKLQYYLRHGVRAVWVVDPDAETVDVYAPGADPLLLGRGDALDGGTLLPGFTLAMDELFAQLVD